MRKVEKMEKKIDKANKNIASLIDELIGARKGTLGNRCPYGENGNPENDCERISCEECVEKYFENMKERLLEEYIVK